MVVVVDVRNAVRDRGLAMWFTCPYNAVTEATAGARLS